MVTTDRIRRYSREGLSFDVLDRGPTDGDVVVLLHGFPQRAACWDAVSERLNAAGLRTLAPDQRGYSPGARPARRRDYRVDELVDDVRALIDQVDGDVHVVGHDWGAVVAWLVAARDPRVRSLTSLSVPHPGAYLQSLLSSGQLLRSWYMGFFQLPAVPERLAARGVFDHLLRRTGMTEQDLEGFRSGVLDDDALAGGLAWYRALPFGLLGGRRLVSERVHVPVTHVWSDGDDALARRTAELAHRWASGEFELRVLQGRSHWLPEHASREVADIVLARVGAAGRAHQSS